MIYKNISVSEIISNITDSDRTTEDVKTFLGILKSKVKGRNKEIKYNNFNNIYNNIKKKKLI
jgi:hypothetical protein